MGLKCDLILWRQQDSDREGKSFATHFDRELVIRTFLNGGLITSSRSWYFRLNTLSKPLSRAVRPYLNRKERGGSV
jgi:hypothetical protein